MMYHATTAAKNMNVGTYGFFKKPGDKKFFFVEYCSAYRANTAAVSFKAVDTAGNVH